MAESLNKIYGIDLGTTSSCIAYVDEYSKPIVVKNFENESVTPSVVFFDEGNVIVGSEAKKFAKLYPDAVVEMVKRSMGDPNFLWEYKSETYRPEELSSYILRKVVGDAEQATGDKITDVVITCPAYFGINQREATAKAGEIAGLHVRAIINEPTAAAIAYGLDRSEDQVVLVYDLGGGTFDITMIEIQQGAITVLCTGGDHNLGGKDWDTAIVTYLTTQFQEQTGTSEDILEDPHTLQELLLSAESAKKSLTQREKTALPVTYEGQKARIELTRTKFNELTDHLLGNTISLTHAMLEEAKIKGHTHFNKILLVGGSTRMPQVPERLQQGFNVPCEIYDPDEAVAKGAAFYGWKLFLDEEIKILIVGENQDGVEDLDFELVDEEEVSQARKEVAKKFNLPVQDVEKASKQKISNVTSTTFGIVALNQAREEKVFNLIRRNDAVPADVTKEFYTDGDNQESVVIRLMEGPVVTEQSELSECKQIGTGDLPLPPGLRAGSPIEVNFKLNEQGRLEVTATERSTYKTIQFEVETAGVMSDQEVEQAKSKHLAMPVS